MAPEDTSGTLPLRGEEDIVASRQKVRALTQQLKFSLVDQTKMITAASEEDVKAGLPTHAKESKIVKLSKFTAADLKMAHQEMDKK